MVTIKAIGILLIMALALSSCGLFSTDYAENCYAKSGSSSGSNGNGSGGNDDASGGGSGSSSGSGSSEAGCSKTPVD